MPQERREEERRERILRPSSAGNPPDVGSQFKSQLVDTALARGPAARFDRRVFLGSAAFILFFQLILPPVVGLADNGDFPKVLGRFSLYARSFATAHHVYAPTIYDVQPQLHWISGFNSTEVPLAGAAIWLNSILSKDGSFDLRFIGIVHSSLFLAALWLFAPLFADARRWLRVLMYALVLFVYCDVMYVSGLNSFYMDEPAFLFLLLSVVLYLRVVRWHLRSDAIWLIVCPLLLTASKAQHAPVGLWIGVLFVVSRKSLWPGARWRSPLAAAALAVTAGWAFTGAAPPDYAPLSVFTMVFWRILPDSKDVGRTMADLGLDDTWRSKIGKTAYSPGADMNNPDGVRAFKRRVSFSRLAAFYATHPKDTYRTLRSSMSVAGGQRSLELGNFDPSAGAPPGTESRAFAVWSNFKRSLFLARGTRLLLTFLGIATVLSSLLWVQRRHLPSGTVAGGFILIAITVTELVISSLADAMDIERHHTIFFALFDMLLLVIICLAATQFEKPVRAIVERRRRHKARATPPPSA